MAKKQKKSAAKPAGWLAQETWGFLMVAGALMLVVSLISFATTPGANNLLGLLGHTLGWAFHALFGLSSYVLAVYLFWYGWRVLFNKPIHYPRLKALYLAIIILSLGVLLSLIEDVYAPLGNTIGSLMYPGLWGSKLRYHLGGSPFFYFYHDLPGYNLGRVFNTLGVALIFSTTLLTALLLLLKVQPSLFFKGLWNFFKVEPPLAVAATAAESDKKGNSAPTPDPESDFLRFVKLRIPGSTLQESASKAANMAISPSQELLEIQPEKNPKVRPSISRKELSDMERTIYTPSAPPAMDAPDSDVRPAITPMKRKREAALAAQSIHNGDFTHYELPPATLLTTPKVVEQANLKKDLKRQAEVLEETLLSFGIEAKVGQINCGPTITSFEVHPAIGVKVQKIKTLDNDIALNMEAKSIRIIAPIPGKAAVGIEVPNSQPQEVGFKDMLLAYQQGSQKFHIPVLLGKAVNGDYVMNDLAKMPHCIIAGATGSGKSVCINTIIMSIVMNCKPNQVKLIMVDPKKVELTPYSKLPHMLAPVITEPRGAAAALNWLVKEMENRYEILKLVGVRNIDGFNKRAPNKEFEASLDRDIPAAMPYIVGIIDELADLMMVASQDIETPIARIAQMARAVGIHLILATQRPSREVITGLIKANFPTRISFKVASRVNSQIVLDEIGAESLLGNGDMLFLPPGTSQLLRAQGAFIRDEDILAVNQRICEQAPPSYVISSFDQFVSGDSPLDDADALDLDDLYEEAKDVVLSTGNASTTFLQRKLKIGYARAASLMDQMEAQGVVGPSEGSKPRKIFARKAQKDEEAPEGGAESASDLNITSDEAGDFE